MNRYVYNVLQDVKGEVYFRLVQHSLSLCNSFSLVVRHSIHLSPPAETVLTRLKPFLIRSEESSEWPGTQLLDSTAQVNTFELSPASASILAEVAEGLFSWCQPELPEDLCLIRRDGDSWLVTIAHEEDAYFVLSPEEHLELAKNVQNLSLSVNELP